MSEKGDENSFKIEEEQKDLQPETKVRKKVKVVRKTKKIQKKERSVKKSEDKKENSDGKEEIDEKKEEPELKKEKGESTEKKKGSKKEKAQTKEKKKATKKTATKTTTKTERKPVNKESLYRKLVAEAIASCETQETNYVSDRKIREYIYKYAEEVKQPKFMRRHISATLDEFVNDKLLFRKRKMYRFTAEGRKRIVPTEIPKRKEVRLLKKVEDNPEHSVKESRSVFITKSGRLSMKLF